DNAAILATNFFGAGGGNTLTIGGLLTNEAGGTFTLNGPVDMATLGSLNNAGTVNVDNGSTLNVTHDATNSGDIFTDPGANNKVNIGGNLTNIGTFRLNGPGDMATIGGSLNNSGNVDVGSSTLAISGDATNSGILDDGFGKGK